MSIADGAQAHVDRVLESPDFRAFRQGCDNHEARHIAVQMLREAYLAGTRYHQGHAKKKPTPEPFIRPEARRTAQEIAAQPARENPFPRTPGKLWRLNDEEDRAED